MTSKPYLPIAIGERFKYYNSTGLSEIGAMLCVLTEAVIDGESFRSRAFDLREEDKRKEINESHD